MRIFNRMRTKSGFALPGKITVEDKYCAGFTLVEVLVTTAILVFIVGVFLSTFMQYSNLIAIGSAEDIALSAAAARLEEIANTDLTNVMDWNGTNFAVQGLIAPIGQPNPGAVTVTQVGATNLFNINVTITWQERGRTIIRTTRVTLMRR